MILKLNDGRGLHYKVGILNDLFGITIHESLMSVIIDGDEL